MHVYSDHRHPGAKKRKFPLIAGPHSYMRLQIDCSTRGMDLLETREPESEPRAILAQGKLDARFELIQRGRLVAAKRFSDQRIRDMPKHTRTEDLYPGNDLSIAFRVDGNDWPHPA